MSASCRPPRSRRWPPSRPRRSSCWPRARSAPPPRAAAAVARGGRRLSRIADLQDIVDDLEAELLRPISVEDRRWRLLAHSAQPDETDAVRRSSILTRETAPAVAAWL